MEFSLAELSRKLANLIRFGLVAEADYQAARVRVRCGELTTEWLPWLTARAAAEASWWAPRVGEQVILLSPSGDPAQAVALPALYLDPIPFDSADRRPDLHQVRYADGAEISYDESTHTLSATLPFGGIVDLIASGGVNIVGPVTVEGTITATDDITSGGTVAGAVVTSQGNVQAGGDVIYGGDVEQGGGLG